MAGYKINRITSDIKISLSELLREVKDPRVSKLLSIVKVDVSGDLSYATVYVSAIEGFESKLSSAWEAQEGKITVPEDETSEEVPEA